MDKNYIYVGEFKDDLKHGRGREEERGISYEGDFEFDHRHGDGELVTSL